MNKNIILVYGGRDFDDWDCVYAKLDQVYKDYGLGGQFPQDPFGDGTKLLRGKELPTNCI